MALHPSGSLRPARLMPADLRATDSRTHRGHGGGSGDTVRWRPRIRRSWSIKHAGCSIPTFLSMDRTYWQKALREAEAREET
jgi:hypothetical protein